MITNLFYTVDTGSTFEEREEVLAMYNENDENRFEENQDRMQQEQETGYGSYQSHPGQYDYYDRYRQEDGGAEGSVPKKGKRKRAKKISQP